MSRVATYSFVSAPNVGDSSPVVLSAGGLVRDSLVICNNGGSTLYVKLGTGASSADFTFRLNSNAVLELDGTWQSMVTAIRANGSGPVQVTETA